LEKVILNEVNRHTKNFFFWVQVLKAHCQIGVHFKKEKTISGFQDQMICLFSSLFIFKVVFIRKNSGIKGEMNNEICLYFPLQLFISALFPSQLFIRYLFLKK
jgi:hypothetical protein